MSCSFEEKLTSWLLGDLSPQEQDEVTCHIFTCAECRKECDELRKVLFPLRSALYKDQGLFKVRMDVPWWQRIHPPAWLGRVALLLLSVSIVLTVMSLYHQELTQRSHRGEEPVTHLTFRKPEVPVTLEPLVVPTTKAPELLADLDLGICDELGLEKYVLVPPPVIPGAHWTPRFMTLNQLAMLNLLPGSKESVHERLMRELPEAQWNLNEGPVRKFKKRRLSPAYQPEIIFYAAPVYTSPTNRVQSSSPEYNSGSRQ
jgi:hypothetical protein